MDPQDSASSLLKSNYSIAVLLKNNVVVESFLVFNEDGIIELLQKEYLIISYDKLKNFCGIGYIFDIKSFKSKPSSPYPSWIFNEDRFEWVPPHLIQKTENSIWDESAKSWINIKKIPKKYIPKVEEM